MIEIKKESYSTIEFYSLLFGAQLLDARGGGLINGRSHSEGNIYLYYFDGNQLLMRGNMQGGEFLMNSLASIEYQRRLQEINQDRPHNFTIDSPKIPLNPSLSEKSIIISTHSEPEKLLWIELSQFIVNHYSTEKYLKELEEMNFKTNAYRTIRK